MAGSILGQGYLAGFGMTIGTGIHLEPKTVALILTLQDGGVMETDCVFYATGRVPKLDGLFAEGVSVQTRDNGAVIVDDAFQTSEPGIHALGDVTTNSRTSCEIRGREDVGQVIG